MDIENFRMALSYWLILKLGDMGKVQLQKFIYFLQESFGVPSGYYFKMYHYGPYSEELETDLTMLRQLGYISIDRDEEGYGYHLKPIDAPEGEWESLIFPYLTSVDTTIETFGHLSASDLELFATIHYVKELVGGIPQQGVVDIVSSLKPKFTQATIDGYYNQMQGAGLLGI